MKRPAFGHLLGYTTLTLVLTAGAAQSLAGSNTVTSDDIVDRTIGTQDIKVGAFAGQSILDNAVTGTDINESTLVLRCRSGLSIGRDACYGPERTADDWLAALGDCTDEGLRLPGISEAKLISAAAGDDSFLWTEAIVSDTEAVVTSTSGLDFALLNSNRQYRCVTTVGARP